MITKENLNSIDFTSIDTTFYYNDGWEYGFNIKTQELWYINDGFGEEEFLCRVTKFDELKELLEILPDGYSKI